MSNSVPPLLCCTPPPIDFRQNNEDDDDFGSFESAEIFEQYNDQISVPVSPPSNLYGNDTQKQDETPIDSDMISDFTSNTNSPNNSRIAKDNQETQKDKNFELDLSDKIDDISSEKNLEYYENITSETSNSSNAGGESDFLQKGGNADSIQDESTRSSREGSLQSLELYVDNLSDGDEDDEVVESDYQVYDDRNICCEDNVSLPSLKLDSIGTSKNPTPTFDQKQTETNLIAADEKRDSGQIIDSFNEDNKNAALFEADFAAFDNYVWNEGGTETSFPVEKNSDAKQQSTSTFETNVKEASNLSDADSDFGDFSTAANVSDCRMESSASNIVTSNFTPSAEGEQNQEDADDEFGGFTDFQKCHSSKPEVKMADLGEQFSKILTSLFPQIEIINEGGELCRIEKHNNIIVGLKNPDVADALGYQWSKSNMKHSLIQALGIDSRNILHGGERWNSSMPRFAANLGFEPLKPLTQTNISKSSKTEDKPIDLMTGKSLEPDKKEIPAVQFDWDSAGLVNPLDGIKEILHERASEEVLSKESSELKQTKYNQTSQETRPPFCANSEYEPPRPPLTKNDTFECQTISNDQINSSKQEDIKIKSDSVMSPTQSSYIIPLKETHIFAGNEEIVTKRETKSSNIKCPLDFDYEIAATGIIIDEQVVKKEYRDVEYNPNRLSSNIEIDNCKNLDSFSNPILPEKGEVLNTGLGQLESQNYILQPTPSSSLWTDNANSSQISHFDNATSQIDLTDGTKNCSVNNVKQIDYYQFFNNTGINSNGSDATKPEHIISGNNVNTDDDFSDFQSSVPQQPISNVMKENLNTDYGGIGSGSNLESSKEMILSPSILMPQTNPTVEKSIPSNIANSTIDSLQNTNFNDIYKEPFNNISSTIKNNTTAEEDEWNDFVSGPTNIVQSTAGNMLCNQSTTLKGQTGDDDDWSDFIGSFPPPTQNLSNQNSVWQSTSSLTNSTPQFSSWNQPSFPPNTFSTDILQPIRQTTTQSNSIFSVPNESVFSIQTKASASETNSNIQRQNFVFDNKSQNNFCFNKKEPSISLIPDLGFAEPRNFVSSSKGSFIRK